MPAWETALSLKFNPSPRDTKEILLCETYSNDAILYLLSELIKCSLPNAILYQEKMRLWIYMMLVSHGSVMAIMCSILIKCNLNSFPPRQDGRHFGRSHFKCIFLNVIELRFKFHWNLFQWVQLTKCQHWFRKWFGAEQATSHYLNQCWPISLMHIWGTRGEMS